MPKFKFAVSDAADQTLDSDYSTFHAFVALMREIFPDYTRADADAYKGKLTLAVGHLGEMNGVIMEVEPNTGEFKYTFQPLQNNPWSGHEAELKEIYAPYVYDDDADTAKERMRDVRGLIESSKSGLPVPEDVQGKIGSFLTGEKGDLKSQLAKLKTKATGQGRKKTKRSSKKRRTTRRR